MTRHYLDHNATAPVRPEVIDAVVDAMACDGNALSVHEEGRRARKILDEAREAVRALVNGPVNGVVFTSGGTEAIHLAIHGLAGANDVRRIFVSAIEHSAVAATAAMTGADVETIPALSSGQVDLDWLKKRLGQYDVTRDGGFLVCVMFANNETGVIQPVRDIADVTHDAGGLFFCDACQAVGKVPVNFVMSGADAMSLTGHKFGGPLGAGALVVGPNLPLAPQFRGGGHEENRRSGTHNVPALAGLGVAARLAEKCLARADGIARLRDRMQDRCGKRWRHRLGQRAGALARHSFIVRPRISCRETADDYGLGRHRHIRRVGLFLRQVKAEPCAHRHGRQRRRRHVIDTRFDRLELNGR